jgi:hypothetical protein
MRIKKRGQDGMRKEERYFVSQARKEKENVNYLRLYIDLGCDQLL